MTDNTEPNPTQASETLFSRLYDELRDLAGRVCFLNGTSATIQPTVLVSEVYLKLHGLVDEEPIGEHGLLALAAKAMRQVCIDHARAVRAQKRGGDWQRVTITNAQPEHGSELVFDLLDLDTVLEELGNYDERQLRVVELRFFGGLSAKQIAEVLGISPKRVELDWRMARAWLAVRLADDQPEADDDER